MAKQIHMYIRSEPILRVYSVYPHVVWVETDWGENGVCLLFPPVMGLTWLSGSPLVMGLMWLLGSPQVMGCMWLSGQQKERRILFCLDVLFHLRLLKVIISKSSWNFNKSPEISLAAGLRNFRSTEKAWIWNWRIQGDQIKLNVRLCNKSGVVQVNRLHRI